MNRHFRGLISSRPKPDRRWVRERTALIVAEELLEMSLGRMRLSVAAGLGPSSTARTHRVVVALTKNKQNEQQTQFRKVFLREPR